MSHERAAAYKNPAHVVEAVSPVEQCDTKPKTLPMVMIEFYGQSNEIQDDGSGWLDRLTPSDR